MKRSIEIIASILGIFLLLPFCDMHFQDLILEMNELRYRLTELENEKLQYEKKLKSTKVSHHKSASPGVYMKRYS